ncbi:hypothetical protein DDF62_06560 [Caulobacter radicis]|uniref:hypothetical protein n=1 Tax=Caulobacter radicis TaxID=2172650 RepID=UPI000D587CB2|nr:hypothetical protein [Caulobacter radicis]PVM91684.1 hypothetical protein DDF62_06560 [Caulobacter radicis]
MKYEVEAGLAAERLRKLVLIALLSGLAAPAALAAEPPLTLKALRDLPPEQVIARAFASSLEAEPRATVTDTRPDSYALYKVETSLALRPVADRVCRQQVLTFRFAPQSATATYRTMDPPSVVDRLTIAEHYRLVAPGRSDCAGAAWPPFRASSDIVAADGVRRLEALLAAPERWRFSCAQPGCDLSKVRVQDLRGVWGEAGGELMLNGEMAGRTGWTITMSAKDDVAVLSTGPTPPS